MAKSHDTSLKDILRDISDGITQLPEFQRDWVWDDERIRALIASIICSYPVGAVMFLECGGSGIHFKSRMLPVPGTLEKRPSGWFWTGSSA